ncbi:MAG: hypothetical protein MJA27_32370, partial [Pseudanabaenales cyanobacterium]|nr:hypothetical protein [Pseudanabaenales cyanobacterium]
MDAKSLTTKVINNPKKLFRKAKKLLEHSAEDTYKLIFKRSSWTSVVNQKELRITGLRRSGNHAIVEW